MVGSNGPAVCDIPEDGCIPHEQWEMKALCTSRHCSRWALFILVADYSLSIERGNLVDQT